MRKIFILFSLSLFFLSCNKATDTVTSTARFYITGLKDIDLTNNANASVTIPISVLTNTGSISDTVTLSASNVPKGLYVEFNPNIGKTPFNVLMTVRSDLTGAGGLGPITITGSGKSGSKSYEINVNSPLYRGWKIGGVTYFENNVVKNTDTTHENANFKVFGRGAGLLIVSFAKGKGFPTKTKTYAISSNSSTKDDNITIGFTDNAQIFSATGNGNPTGTFTVDTTGKFVFSCTGVEMTNGVEKKILDCAVNE